MEKVGFNQRDAITMQRHENLRKGGDLEKLYYNLPVKRFHVSFSIRLTLEYPLSSKDIPSHFHGLVR